jgi:hypothetical protein
VCNNGSYLSGREPKNTTVKYNISAKVQFDLLKYLLSELHSGIISEHLVIAGVCDLHHPANLPAIN